MSVTQQKLFDGVTVYGSVPVYGSVSVYI